MTPGALLAVHLAEGVVQQHVGRAGIEGARIVADDRIEAEQGLDRIALEPLGQEVRRRFGEEIEEEALRFEIEFAQCVAKRRGAGKLPQAAPAEALHHVRRRLQDQVSQDVGDDSACAQ